MMNQYYGFGHGFPLIILVLIVAWTLFWKIYAVWTAVKNNHKGWFIALIILNTCGILEIIYLFVIADKKWVDIKKAFASIFGPKKNLKKTEPDKEEVVK